MTSWVTVVWSAIASSCLTLAAAHALIGLRLRERANLLFAVNSLSVTAIAAFELAMMRAATPAELGFLIRWIHVPIFVLFVSFVLFVRAFFRAGPPWLGWAVVATRGAALLVNFLRRPNLNFVEISALDRVGFLGEEISVARGVVSRWTRLGELGSVLLLAFLLSASVAIWRRGERRRAIVVGGSMVLFVLGAAGHTALLHAGIVVAPYLISVAYVGIVAAMGYELTSDVIRASELARQLRKKESALGEAEQRLALAAGAAGLGFWSWDVSPDEVWMTPRGRALRGLAIEERLDLSRFLSTVHPEEREAVKRSLESAAAHGDKFDYECRVVLPDGKLRWVSVHGAGGVDRADGRPRVRAVSIDVTARKHAEAEAKQRQNEITHLSRVAMLGELSGSLAHELNQPLTAIMSNAQAALRFLKQGDGGLGEIREILADIVDEDRHAGEVIQRLRLLLKKAEVRPEALDLAVLVDDVLRLMRVDLMTRGVRAATEIPGGLAPVLGDRVQVEQVLVNLIANACDAMAGRASGARSLSLRVGPDGPGAVRVSVSDAGCGLPAGEIERVFEPFVTTKPQGLGLGLAVCRTIVVAHRGRLWAENNAGPGATFHFTLPVFGAA